MLRAPTRDAEALADVLRNPLIGGFEVDMSVNEPAYVVSEKVEEFFADRGTEDLLLLHFSCHGVKDEGGELYFAAANTKLRRLGATGVAADFVNRRMNRSRSRRIVLLLDCCYAGAFERGMTHRAGAGMNLGDQLGGRGRAVITASSAMEYSFESGELADTADSGPSVFTGALVDGLATGEADRNQDGLITLDELYDYVYAEVRASSPNQTPGKWVFGVQGELYIARRSQRLSEPAPLPVELCQLIDSPLPSVRAVAVRELEKLLHGRHLGLAEAAQQGLRRLADDDSRSVSAAAAAALQSDIPQPVLPLASPIGDQPRPPSQPVAASGRPPSPPLRAVDDADRPTPAVDPARRPPVPAVQRPSSAGTPRTPRPPAPFSKPTPAVKPRRADPVILRRVAGLLMVAAAVLISCNPFFLYSTHSELKVIDHGPLAVLPALVLAALVAAAGVGMLGAHTGRVVGSGIALGQSAAWPWSIVNLWEPMDDWEVATWLWFAALLTLVLAAGLTALAVSQTDGIQLQFELPTEKRWWTVTCLSVLTIFVLLLFEIDVGGSPWASTGSKLISAAPLLAVPVCATVAVPRRFRSALLLGWCGVVGIAAYYSARHAYNADMSPERVIMIVGFAAISAVLLVTIAFLAASGLRTEREQAFSGAQASA